MPLALTLATRGMAIDFFTPILMVEDSGATAQIVSRLLKQLGFRRSTSRRVG